jgi:hypothetical protein
MSQFLPRSTPSLRSDLGMNIASPGMFDESAPELPLRQALGADTELVLNKSLGYPGGGSSN